MSDTPVIENTIVPEIDGFHLHNDEGHLSVTEFSAQLRKIQRRLRKTGFSPQIINLGGGLSNYTSAEVRKLFKQARNIFRNTPHIFFEPGRLFHNNSGYACGKILSSKPGTRPILTTNLSKECHLKWSNQNLPPEKLRIDRVPCPWLHRH
jgi:diaminopimelate decarboxylase